MVDEPEEPIVLESAHRHGVTDSDMLHALRFAVYHVSQADNMVMFIGPDAAGTLIELRSGSWSGGVENSPSPTPCAHPETSTSGDVCDAH